LFGFFLPALRLSAYSVLASYEYSSSFPQRCSYIK